MLSLFRTYPPGIGQQTTATQALTRAVAPVGRSMPARRKRRSRPVAGASAKTRRRRRTNGRMRLVKGSAAARRYMARLRRMRRR